jgi:hypothetical protein
VDFFLTQRSTQRTPQERGFSPSDQRHNLTAAATIPLSFDMQFSAIVKLISGSPMLVQAGADLDGDRSDTGDRPSGLPRFGALTPEPLLRLISEFRANLTAPLPPVDRARLDLDPYRSIDVRFSKSLSAGFDLLAEAFNMTNHKNIVPTAVSRNMNTAAFLERRAARDSRQIQWGVRVSF